MTESSLIFDLPAVVIRRIVVSDVANNIYLLTSKQTGDQVLIDAAADPQAIDALLKDAAGDSEASTAIKLIATTHSHWDHVRALAEVSKSTGAPNVSGRADAAAIEAESGIAPDRLLDDGDTIDIAGFTLKAVHLRGHTPGSIAFVLEATNDDASAIIFSGDSLFPGGVGNTENNPERFESLLNDVEDRLFDVYRDDSIVLPGHGAATTLGTERPVLGEWRLRGW